ncbi:nucleotidyltransferase [Mucilaginibacter sp. PAMB04274]|uniref:nucleotidyltransferase n=1 Tax=Mucilaginibacter sp. PAMB04274 TaxID=3138568 RepID=UPI0031F69F2B
MFRVPSTFQNNDQLDQWLNKIGEALDLTAAQYKAVEDRYTAVANYLAETPGLKLYKPEIKPQGSFLLGTMIKPIMQDDELDIDLVCRLTGKQASWTQYHLKQAIGDELKANGTYKRMLDEEGNRCWTLLYAESTKFHMDILPALVGQEHYQLMERSFSALENRQVDRLSIKITDKRLPNHRTEVQPEFWPKSNPFGYAGWFNERARLSATKLMSLRESVEALPEHASRKEPLKRIIQILKRHRDMTYGGDDDKPISIIITTLAAKAYQKEENIVAALLNILNRMESFIELRYSAMYHREIKWVANPVNDVENFADKWPDEPNKEDNFYAWLNKAKEDFSVLAGGDLGEIARVLKAVIGTSVINETIDPDGIGLQLSENYSGKSFDRSLLHVPHRERVRWPENLKYRSEIQGSFKQGKKRHTILANTVVPKGCDIYFVASTNVPRPFDVYWQVVNTGQEAANSSGLRGGIYASRTLGVGGLNQKEYSSFRGTHWIECFIVKEGTCVARSSEFIVNIA